MDRKILERIILGCFLLEASNIRAKVQNEEQKKSIDHSYAPYVIKKTKDQYCQFSRPLRTAIQNLDEPAFKALIAQGKDINAVNCSYETLLLYFACSNCCLKSGYDEIELLLKCRADPNIQGLLGTFPTLYHRLSKYKKARLLLEYGADPNAESTIFGQKIGYGFLHSAITRRKSLEFVKLLLEYGADVNALDAEGLTALDIALKEKS
jgi:ankyrin repeat protein